MKNNQDKYTSRKDGLLRLSEEQEQAEHQALAIQEAEKLEKAERRKLINAFLDKKPLSSFDKYWFAQDIEQYLDGVNPPTIITCLSNEDKKQYVKEFDIWRRPSRITDLLSSDELNQE